MNEKYKVVEDEKRVIDKKNDIFKECVELFGSFEYRTADENKDILNYIFKEIQELQKIVDDFHKDNDKGVENSLT